LKEEFKVEMIKLAEQFFDNIPGDKYGIDLMEFEKMVILGDIKDYFLLDVREKTEFEQQRIPGSINIPYAQISTNLDKIPEDKKIIIISNTGIVAAQISSLLNACGYRTWVLREGIEGYIDIGGYVESKEFEKSA
jgi:rhodanese-related sulfurtransferase